MQYVTESDRALLRAGQQITLSLYIDREKKDYPIVNAKYHAGVASGEDFSIGNTIAASIELKLDVTGILVKGKFAKVTWKINTTEYPLIEGIIDSSVQKGFETTIVINDYMYTLGALTYTIPDKFKSSRCSLRDVFTDVGINRMNISTRAAISDFSEIHFENGIGNLGDTVLCSTILSNLACAYGGNCRISRDGVLEIVKYEEVNFKDDPYDADNDANADEFNLNGITFKRTDKTQKDNDGYTTEEESVTKFTASKLNGISDIEIEYNLASQTLVDKAFDNIKNVSSYGGTASFSGAFDLEPSDIIEVDSLYRDAYKQAINEINIEYDGGHKVTITGLGNIKTEGIAAASGTVRAELSNIKTDYGNFKTLIADAFYATTAKIKSIEANSITTDTLEAGYAKIDLENVNNSWIDKGIIKDGSISDAKILSVSANKLTAGEIDASKITVTNLNADNLTVGTINGARIGNESITLEKLTEEVPTKEYVDSLKDNLQNQIDGAIQTWTSTTIPTANNYPASSWKTDKERKTHVGDVLYVVNAGNSADGYCYRYTESDSGAFSWTLIKDTDVTSALQQLLDVQGNIKGLQEFETTTKKWITDTEDTLETKFVTDTKLSTALGGYVNKTTVNDVVESALQNSSTITEIKESVDNVQVGGRNLLLDSDAPSLSKVVSQKDRYFSDANNAEYCTPSFDKSPSGVPVPVKNIVSFKWNVKNELGSRGIVFYDGIGVPLATGKKYTVSMYARVRNNDAPFKAGIGYGVNLFEKQTAVTLNSNWQRIIWTFEAPEIGGYTYANGSSKIYFFTTCTKTFSEGIVDICGFMLERGVNASDWQLAPEDTTEFVKNITNTVNQNIQTATENLRKISSLESTVNGDGETVGLVTQITSVTEKAGEIETNLTTNYYDKTSTETKIKETSEGIFASMTDINATTGEQFRNKIRTTAQGVFEELTDVGKASGETFKNTVKTTAQGVFEELTDTESPAGETFKTKVSTTAKGIFEELTDVDKASGASFKTKVENTAKGVFTTLTNGNEFKTTVKNTAEGAVTTVIQNYPTKSQMYTALGINSGQIMSEVYLTKNGAKSTYSSITQTDRSINLKVGVAAQTIWDAPTVKGKKVKWTHSKYGTPKENAIKASANKNKYYLDVKTGKYYYSDGKNWIDKGKCKQSKISKSNLLASINASKGTLKFNASLKIDMKSAVFKVDSNNFMISNEKKGGEIITRNHASYAYSYLKGGFLYFGNSNQKLKKFNSIKHTGRIGLNTCKISGTATKGVQVLSGGYIGLTSPRLLVRKNDSSSFHSGVNGTYSIKTYRTTKISGGNGGISWSYKYATASFKFVNGICVAASGASL